MPQRFVLQEPNGEMLLQEYEPTPPHGSLVQVRNLATSLNHLDWKRIDKNLLLSTFPHVLGMDIAGEVVAGTSQVLKKGDLIVAPGVVGNSDRCSFQTHVLVDENHCAKIDRSVPILEASTLPFSLATAACGLFLGLGLPTKAENSASSLSVLIWGANGNVGKLAVQLAKLSGYHVVAVVSHSAHISAVQARGADEVFINGDLEITSKIQTVAPIIRNAFDTVVSNSTVSLISGVLVKPARLATAIKYLGQPPDDVEVVPVFSGEIFGQNMIGAPSEAGAKIGSWIWDNLAAWVREGKIKPLESRYIGTLEDIPNGLQQLREGSAKKKLVISIV